MTWHNLLFAHWPIDEEALRPHVPSDFEIDRFDGQAWIAVVPFSMSNVVPRGAPALPWISAFPELNVRTYVRVGGRPGVCFFSLDAASPLAVIAARTFFHLPYFRSAMTVEEQDGWIRYHSERKRFVVASGFSRTYPTRTTRAEFRARYRPVGVARAPSAGTLEHFLTERYCLFTADRKLRTRTVDIHHPSWPLQPAEAEIEVNTMTDAAGIALGSDSPVLHFAKRQDVVAWPLRLVS